MGNDELGYLNFHETLLETKKTLIYFHDNFILLRKIFSFCIRDW